MQICYVSALSKVKSHDANQSHSASKQSDKVYGPTGLEEMVHTDPVRSQVGSPFSDIIMLTHRKMHTYGIQPVPYICSLYIFINVTFCHCAVTSTRVTLPSSMAT